MADFWMYSDLEPLTIVNLLQDSPIRGKPYPDAKKYITADWHGDCEILVVIKVIRSKTILGDLSLADIEEDINYALRKAWKKDLPDITWKIETSEFRAQGHFNPVSQFDIYIDVCEDN